MPITLSPNRLRVETPRNTPRTRSLTWAFAGQWGGLRLIMCSDQGAPIKTKAVRVISTPSDLAKFAGLLLDGKLLAPEQLAQMRKMVDAPLMPGWRYGRGVFSIPLSCGGEYWGHGGDIDGYETRGGATDDGRSVGLAVTAPPGTFSDAEESAKAVMSATDTAFCN
ncbi:serine hydrolase [Streptomyces sp. cmx-18-6]|uniref:serine hydrolase n=1 Tax=Streptomyces sp. cmx-18-6 TaxID=2790930 RepID=UPI0039806FE5